MMWRQTVMAELREMGLSWGEAQVRTVPCGETLLWPYVPLGTKRISKKSMLPSTCDHQNVIPADA